ncbi:MAG: ABC transporter substrate-binding protein [Pseudomonadota bacterium]
MTMRRQALVALGKPALCLWLMGLLLTAPAVATASESESQAIDVVRGLAANIWPDGSQRFNTLERERHLADAIAGSTNVDLLSRLVLGRHWRSLDAEDRAEYQALFSTVIIGSLAVRLDNVLRELDGPLEEHFVITGSMHAGKKDVLVRSKVMAADGRPLSVDWRLRALDDGPAIIDLVVEGVSLLVSQRAEFASVIERDRIDGLIEALRRRAQAADSS